MARLSKVESECPLPTSSHCVFDFMFRLWILLGTL